MKIPLPENYSYNEDSAYVKDGVLYIRTLDSFRALMHDITYNIRDGTKCHYCLKPVVRKRTATLDHMIPQNLGGPTIPNNLCVSCPNCNSLKSNMTEQEYFYYLSLPEKKRKGYVAFLQDYKEFLKKRFVPVVSEDWIEYEPIENIILDLYTCRVKDNKGYKKISNYYKKYGRIWKPIIVDKNHNLLDGFTTLLFCADNNIKTIPVIVLENVEYE